jgi:hypothetical protein
MQTMNKKCKKNANAYIPPQTKQLLETARGGRRRKSPFLFRSSYSLLSSSKIKFKKPSSGWSIEEFSQPPLPSFSPHTPLSTIQSRKDLRGFATGFSKRTKKPSSGGLEGELRGPPPCPAGW